MADEGVFEGTIHRQGDLKIMPETTSGYDKFRSFADQGENMLPGYAHRSMPSRNGQTGELRKLSSLLEMSHALGGTLRLKAGLNRALEILERYHGATRSVVTILKEGTSELHIEASRGITVDSQEVRYYLVPMQRDSSRWGQEIGISEMVERPVGE